MQSLRKVHGKSNAENAAKPRKYWDSLSKVQKFLIFLKLHERKDNKKRRMHRQNSRQKTHLRSLATSPLLLQISENQVFTEYPLLQTTIRSGCGVRLSLRKRNGAIKSYSNMGNRPIFGLSEGRIYVKSTKSRV